MRNWLAFLIVLLSTAGMVSQNGPVGGLDAIKTDKSQLWMDVAVYDSLGRAVTNLNRSDFELLEDGVPQKISSFTPVDTPYNVLLLLDCREATRDRLSLLAGAITRFAKLLKPGDRLEIAIFGREVQVVRDWNSNPGGDVHMGDTPGCGNTDLYGAVKWSSTEVLKVSGRRSVVVFSNGYQTEMPHEMKQVNGINMQHIVPPAKDTEFQKILKIVHDGGTPFHFIAVDTDFNPGNHYAGPVQDLQQVRARVEQLAEVSGGRIVYPRESSDVVPMFLQIGRDLGASYSMAFTPQHAMDGYYHSIDVRVRDEESHVFLSRKGYTAN